MRPFSIIYNSVMHLVRPGHISRRARCYGRSRRRCNQVIRTLVLVIAACTQPRSTRCKQVCARESECITATSNLIPFDEKECIAACTTLEADVATVAKVQRHADCVATNTDCRQVLACP